MKTPIIIGVIFLILLPIAVAVDFTPSGNINGRNIYDIYNFKNIFNVTNITSIRFFGDGTYVTNVSAQRVNESNVNVSKFVFPILQFNTTSGAPTVLQNGQCYYTDGSDNTYNCVVDAANGVVQQIGEELYLDRPAKNGDNVTIPNCAPVYLSGSTGNNAIVKLASGDSYRKAQATIGLATQIIAPNGFGRITRFGAVNDCDTSNFTAGQQLFLTDTKGVLTNIPPTGTTTKVVVGSVIRSNQNNGAISVSVVVIPSLDDLTFVNASLKNNTVLIYNNASRLWESVNLNTIYYTQNQTYNASYIDYLISNISLTPGPAGPQGPQGLNGTNAYNITIENNITNNIVNNITNNITVTNNITNNITVTNNITNTIQANLTNVAMTNQSNNFTQLQNFVNATFTGTLIISNLNQTTSSIGYFDTLFENGTSLVLKYLGINDQRYNDTLSINTTNARVTAVNSSLSNYELITSHNNDNTTLTNLINTKLNISDQRYNETSLINVLNTSAAILPLYANIQKDPQGFGFTTNTELNTQSTLLFNDATRNFTISPIGSYTFYIGGVLYNNTVNKSLVISNASGNHIIYFTPANVLAETSVLTEAVLCSNAIVAIVNWDTTKSLSFEDERHSHFMECVTHLELHETIGTHYESGLDLTNVTVGGSANINQSAQLGVTAGQISDEDLHHDISAYINPATIKTYYSWGVAGNWSFKYDKFPFCYSGACGYTGANGRLGANTGLTTFTQCANSNYILTHIFANNAVNGSQDIFAVTGTTCYTSAALATTGATNEIATIMSTNAFNAEIKPLYSLLLLTTTGATNTPHAAWAAPSTGGSFIDYRTSAVSGVSGITQSGTVTNVGTDNTLTVNGVTGGSITSSGTLGIDNTYIQQFNDTARIDAVNLSLSNTDSRVSIINSTVQGLVSSNTSTNSRIDTLNSSKANLASPTFTGTAVFDAANFTGIVWINNINSTNTTGFSAATSFIEGGISLINKYASITALQNTNTTANGKASPGTCAAGTIVQNTTTTGVQCITDKDTTYTATSPWIILTSTAFSWNSTLGDLTYLKPTSKINASQIENSTWISSTPYQSTAAGWSNNTANITTSLNVKITGNLTVTDTLIVGANAQKFYYYYHNSTFWRCYNGSGIIENMGNASITC